MSQANLIVHLRHRGQPWTEDLSDWRFMSYTPPFYEEYRAEIASPGIRKVHDEMFAAFASLCGDNHDVLDLGCGTCEFHRYDDRHRLYFGIDKFHAEPGMPCRIGDYSDAPKECPFEPTAFISLFSTELVLPLVERYRLYESLFRDNTTIRAAMVPGFYYPDRANDVQAVERVASQTYTSYQTIEHPRDVRSDVFREFRSYVRMESKMFGPYVEVWKFLIRK